MYSFVFISLIFAQTYGAPTDIVTPPIPMTPPTQAIDVVSMVSLTADESTDTTQDTTPLPPSIEAVEETPNDLMMEKETILDGGKHLSEAITAKIVGPIVIFNSKVAAAAGALPPMLAAKGAILGSAIATPIEIGAVAGSSIVSGVTGKLVAVPISVATGTFAKFVAAAEKGREIWNFNVEHGGEVLKDGAIRMGHIILKPIAVIVGANTAVAGAGLGLAGTGIKGVGVGVGTVGAKMIATGLAAKGLGTTIIKSQFVK